MGSIFKQTAIMVVSLFLLGGCSAGISKQARSQVTFTRPFSEMQQHPDDFIGETAILGGKIIETTPLQGATELNVLQLSLDSQQRPRDNDQSQGRFLVVSDQFLDPAIYAKGEFITVVGRLEASVKRFIGQREYLYPRLRAVEIKLWKKSELKEPKVHLGIGFGTSF